jgi:hypothetical protein
MYVMSSLPPSQQSVAGGILQTVSRLAQTIGFGVTTAVFNAVQKKPTLASYWDLRTQPYTATFLVSVACSVLSVMLVPFLTLGTQGGKQKQESTAFSETVEEISSEPK